MSNFKCQIYKLKFKSFKILVIVLSFAICVLRLAPSVTFAVESTPSADIKLQLEQLKIEIASKAAKLKDEVNRKLKNKTYIGKVKSKSETSITIASGNSPKIININQDTEYVSKVKTRKFSAKSLAEEDFIAALGDADEQGVLTAKRIILLPITNVQSPKSYLWGEVIAISDKLLTIKNKVGQNVAVSGINSSKLTEADLIILTGNLNKNDIFEAQFVHVLKKGKPLKTATPSAKEASKSSKP